MSIRTKNLVTNVPAAPPAEAQEHFASKLRFETDCWDVHATIESDPASFVLLDVRSPVSFAEGHLPRALNIPHGQLTPERLDDFAPDALFVVYCAGPHCNGATRAALRLAGLGRAVKEMIGGVTGWTDEGFELVSE